MLVDFGSAKEYVPGTTTSVVAHRSPGYAALEQYRTGTNTRTDIYGLGATLYALLTGVTPLDALSRVLGNTTKGVDPVKPANLLQPSIPLVVAEALQQAMSIRNADRFETVEEFWQAFAAPGTQHIPRTTSIELSQPSPPKQSIEDSSAESFQEEQSSPPSKTRIALRIFAIFLVIVTIGIAFFSYLKGLTILLLCCLGVLLISLGIAILLRTFSSQVRSPQKELESLLSDKHRAGSGVGEED